MMAESIEQRCRDLLELCGIEDAQSMTAGDLCPLANELARLERDHAAMNVVRRYPIVAFGCRGSERWAGIGDGPVYAEDPADAIILAAQRELSEGMRREPADKLERLEAEAAGLRQTLQALETFGNCRLEYNQSYGYQGRWWLTVWISGSPSSFYARTASEVIMKAAEAAEGETDG